jgi:uncharacterized protein YdeI (YjbR/CyaY-like superfamily)
VTERRRRKRQRGSVCSVASSVSRLAREASTARSSVSSGDVSVTWVPIRPWIPPNPIHNAPAAIHFRPAALAWAGVGAHDGLSKLAFSSAAEWEEWLEENHDRSEGLWIQIAKKDSGIDSVRYPEVLETALCFGWIDGRREALDESHFLQRFTPRRPRSKWSRINRDKAEQLISEGRMRQAGLAEVDRARADGRWAAAYEGQKSIAVPDDLERELDARPRAKAFFAELSSQNRYAILYRLQDAKRPETRARRLAKFIAMLEAGETIYPGRG